MEAIAKDNTEELNCEGAAKMETSTSTEETRGSAVSMAADQEKGANPDPQTAAATRSNVPTDMDSQGANPDPQAAAASRSTVATDMDSLGANPDPQAAAARRCNIATDMDSTGVILFVYEVAEDDTESTMSSTKSMSLLVGAKDEEEPDDPPISEDTPCGHKPSLEQFIFLTTARVRASGTACNQYVIFGGYPEMPLLRARVRGQTSEGCCSGKAGAQRGRHQPFSVDLADYNSRAPLVRFVCNEHGRAAVESPPGEVVGYVAAERILCSLWFTLRDLHGAAKLLVKGSRYCERGAFRNFKILLSDQSSEVARLERVDGSADPPGVETEYTVDVPEAMGPEIKAMLVIVIMLFDRKLFA